MKFINYYRMKKEYFYVILLWVSVALWGVTSPLAAQDKLFPEGITTIKDSMFIGREDLTEVVIPEGVTSIGKRAFAGCKNLTSVKLPVSLNYIGEKAFFYCSNLNSVELPNNLTEIGREAFFYCGKITSITLPENLEKIGLYAFVGCPLSDLKELIIPDKVTEIGYIAFGFAPITRVKIGKSVASIKDAFLHCSQLEAYEIDATNPNFSVIDGVLFSKGKDKLLHYPASKSNKSYRLPDETKTMSGNWPFYKVEYLEVVDINQVTTVEKFVDYYSGGAPEVSTVFLICNKLTEIKVSENNPAFSTIDGVLFDKQKGCLEAYPSGSKRETYIIPDGVKSIRYGAFNWGQYLTSVTVPASVKTFGENAFINSFPLKEIHLKSSTPPTLEKSIGTFDFKEFEGTIFVPEGTLSAYRSANVWSKYANLFKEEAKPFEPEVLESTDSTLAITWEPVMDATGYTVKVYTDAAKEELMASYSFDANGQLLKSTDFSFTVENLKAGTTYYIETTAIKQMGDKTTVLAIYTVEAKTSGVATANETIVANNSFVSAYNGQIVIRTSVNTSVYIYDLAGHCIISDKINGNGSYNMPKGLYIVVAGNERSKVIVR